MNKLEIFNELCLMVAAYHLFTFTSFVNSSSMQYSVGWSMIGVTTLNIAVNMIVVGYQTLRNLKMQLKKIVYKYRLWRHQRKEVEQQSKYEVA
jgi:hypothetical protein